MNDWCLKRGPGAWELVPVGSRQRPCPLYITLLSSCGELADSSIISPIFTKLIIRATDWTQSPESNSNHHLNTNPSPFIQPQSLPQIAVIYKNIEVIQMSKDLTSEFTKTLGEQSGSAKSHLDSAVALFGETNKLHDAFAKDLTALVAEVAEFKEKVKKNPHELKKFLVEKLRPLEDELMLGEENQKHENKSAQEIITEIKRENKETSEAIVKTFEKLKHLEIKIGQYH